MASMLAYMCGHISTGPGEIAVFHALTRQIAAISPHGKTA
jgi:hypothetical protein